MEIYSYTGFSLCILINRTGHSNTLINITYQYTYNKYDRFQFNADNFKKMTYKPVGRIHHIGRSSILIFPALRRPN